jgi:hypothetical protein
MTSDPAPVLHMIGSRPAMVATTVMMMGDIAEAGRT